MSPSGLCLVIVVLPCDERLIDEVNGAARQGVCRGTPERYARPTPVSIPGARTASGAGLKTRGATVFRDRVAFFDYRRGDTVGGLHFFNAGFSFVVGTRPGRGRVMVAGGLPEVTHFRAGLPPGTTAVGVDPFSRTMTVRDPWVSRCLMTRGDGSHFVGFVSDAPMAGWPVVEGDTLTLRMNRPSNPRPIH